MKLQKQINTDLWISDEEKKNWEKSSNKNKVKKRMEEKLKQWYMGPWGRGNNLPTFIFIFFLSLFFLISFFYFINVPWPSLLVQVSHHSNFRFTRNKLTFEGQFLCLTVHCLFPNNIKWNNSQWTLAKYISFANTITRLVMFTYKTFKQKCQWIKQS